MSEDMTIRHDAEGEKTSSSSGVSAPCSDKTGKAEKGLSNSGGGMEDGAEVDTDTDECIFCMDSISKDDQGGIECCEHIFHADCIKNWSKFNNQCPLCRRRFYKIRRCIVMGNQLKYIDMHVKDVDQKIEEDGDGSPDDFLGDLENFLGEDDNFVVHDEYEHEYYNDEEYQGHIEQDQGAELRRSSRSARPPQPQPLSVPRSLHRFTRSYLGVSYREMCESSERRRAEVASAKEEQHRETKFAETPVQPRQSENETRKKRRQKKRLAAQQAQLRETKIIRTYAQSRRSRNETISRSTTQRKYNHQSRDKNVSDARKRAAAILRLERKRKLRIFAKKFFRDGKQHQQHPYERNRKQRQPKHRLQQKSNRHQGKGNGVSQTQSSLNGCKGKLKRRKKAFSSTPNIVDLILNDMDDKQDTSSFDSKPSSSSSSSAAVATAQSSHQTQLIPPPSHLNRTSAEDNMKRNQRRVQQQTTNRKRERIQINGARKQETKTTSSVRKRKRIKIPRRKLCQRLMLLSKAI